MNAGRTSVCEWLLEFRGKLQGRVFLLSYIEKNLKKVYAFKVHFLTIQLNTKL